ncbi:hypothetical protein ACFQ68_13340 [Amycolatopsis japonica]|uniref:hypothetical protein n=1 Tax=Amycolatopsis japonica TaxID=208439 RepID=UPI00366AE663
MTATTSYGTWVNHGGGEIDLRTNVIVSLGDFVGDYDIDGLVHAYRNAIIEQLPEGVTMAGDEFYGPYPRVDEVDIPAAIEAVDFFRLAEQFDNTTSTGR